MKTISVPSSAQSTRLAKSANAVNELVQYAKAIHLNQFPDDNAQELLPAIIQALASAYAATVVAPKS